MIYVTVRISTSPIADIPASFGKMWDKKAGKGCGVRTAVRKPGAVLSGKDTTLGYTVAPLGAYMSRITARVARHGFTAADS